MSEGRRYLESPQAIRNDRPRPFNRNANKLFRGSEKSVVELLYSDEAEELALNRRQRSVSLSVLHAGSACPSQQQQQQQLLEPRMAQLETLEAKMASIEVSLSTTPRRKKGSSVSGAGVTSLSAHRSKEHYSKELEVLRVALKDKENIIQTLKGQLCNSLSNRLMLHNGAAPLTEADRKATEERLQRLRRDADNKRLAIKNLKLALDRLDITDNIDVRIQQAELEYRLGREELELLSLREEARSLQAAVELAETQMKQKSDTIYSCIAGSTEVTIHAVEVSADPKSPRFGAGPKDDSPGLYVDWAVEDSGLCKGDRIVEVNGKLVVGASRSDLARLLAVAPDAAQIVVLRKGESLAALRALRSENLRLTHRIGYLEEQVRDLLAPSRTEVAADPAKVATRQDHLQVFQKGPQVTALVANLAGTESLPIVRTGWHRTIRESDVSMGSPASGHHEKSMERQQKRQLRKSTDSLPVAKRSPPHGRTQSKWPMPRLVSAMGYAQNSFKSSSQLRSLEFDSEPTYYRGQDSQSETSGSYAFQEAKNRPVPPKKPLRLSLHRAASLQSVESAPPTSARDAPRKSLGRHQRGNPPAEKYSRKETSDENATEDASQPTPRAPSRAESCQSALRWPSPKPRPHLASVSMDKWC